MRLWLLGSGSKGNATLLECGDTRILIDAGFSARRLAERMRAVGVAPESVTALVLTHEHADHVNGLMSALRRWNWPLHATKGTLAAMPELADHPASFRAGDTLSIGSITLEAVRVSHDAAEPVGFVATSTCSGMRAAIVTDTGVVTPEVRTAVRHADVLVLESNHDVEMLRTGPYPYSLKRRVAGSHGHLSNAAAGRLAAECAHRGLKHLVLAHLSETNNTPATALESLRGAVRTTRWRGQAHAAPQHGVIGPFGDAASVGGQLSLAL